MDDEHPYGGDNKRDHGRVWKKGPVEVNRAGQNCKDPRPSERVPIVPDTAQQCIEGENTPYSERRGYGTAHPTVPANYPI